MKEEAPRWSQLFGDLEAQAEALVSAEEQGEVAERTRIETGRLGLLDRLRAAEGHPVGVRCVGAGALEGRLDRVGPDWLLIAEPAGAEVLVPLSSLLGITGLSRWSAPPGGEGKVAGKLGLRSALRGLARDRAGVRILLADGGDVAGTVDRVGADFLELAEHPLGEPRRASSVVRVWTVPLGRVGVLRRR